MRKAPSTRFPSKALARIGSPRVRRRLENEIRALALSPDGRVLAAASGWEYNPELVIWDLKGTRPRAISGLPRHWISALAFSPDGGLVAFGAGNTVRFASLRHGVLSRTLEIAGGEVGALAFSPDGSTLAVANGWEGIVEVIDAETGAVRCEVDHLANALAFSPTGLLAVGKREGLRLYDPGLAPGTTLKGEDRWVVDLRKADPAFERKTGPPSAHLLVEIEGADASGAVAFSEDGALVACAGEGGDIRLYDATSGEPRESLSERARGKGVCAFSGGLGRFAYSASYEFHVIEMATGAEVPAWDPALLGAGLAFSPDGAALAISAGIEIRLFTPDGKALSRLDAPHDGWLAFSPQRGCIALAERSVSLFDTRARTWREAIEPGGWLGLSPGAMAATPSISFSRDGSLLAVCHGRLALFRTDAPKLLKDWTPYGTRLVEPVSLPSYISSSDDDDAPSIEEIPVSFVAFSKGGLLATAGGDEVLVFDTGSLPSGLDEPILRAEANAFAIWFLPDDSLVTLERTPYRIRHWSIVGGDLRLAGERKAPALRGMSGPPAFSPGGALAALPAGKRIIVVELEDGTQRSRLNGHDDTVASLAFSPDGRLLASSSKDATVIIWKV